MAYPTATPQLHHVKGHGWQTRALLRDPTTQALRCQYIGSVPYAQGTTSRWARAKQVVDSHDQFGPTKETAKDFSSFTTKRGCPQPGGRVEDMHENYSHHLNIYVPLKEAPVNGWPVLVFIHGGYLQWGTNHQIEPSNLMSDDAFDAIIVAPNYRLNAFGFLCSKQMLEVANEDGGSCNLNLGFLDQRLAIEWVWRFIQIYGGDRTNMTLAGLSAGAYSVFHNLAYEVGLPDSEAVIKRIIMFSNGCGLPPKDPVEVQNHYENLLKALDIPLNISAEDQLAILRSLPSSDIVAGVGVIPENSFRAVTDGYFVRKSLFDELRNGSFARVLLRRGIRIMIGECRDEINSYRLTSPPAKLSHLESRLAVEYPKALARVIADRNVPGGKLPCYAATVQDLWGKVYSDLQVHTSERGFITALSEVLPVENIFRYRVEFVTERMSEAHGLAMGVCHGSDYSIWFKGNGSRLTSQEEGIVQEFAIRPMARFITGDFEGMQWGTANTGQVRQLCTDGHTRIESDRFWKSGTREFKKILGWINESKL